VSRSILGFPFYRDLKRLELAIRVSQEPGSKEVDRLLGELVLFSSMSERYLLPALEQIANAGDNNDALRKYQLRQLIGEEWAHHVMYAKLYDKAHPPSLKYAEQLLHSVPKVTAEEIVAVAKNRRSEAKRA
jgi:hypothetical protein